MKKKTIWHKVLNHISDLPEGRVKTVYAGHTEICLSHFDGSFNALTNKCPHQGGPLGEGSIENGLLRCPWHGWDFNPCGGDSEGFQDGLKKYQLKVENDSIYVEIDEESPHEISVSDLMVETLVN